MQNSQLVPPYNPNWLEDFIRRTVRDELAKKEVAQNKPQLSEMEEMALRYNIPLADLESLVRTARDEVAQEERNKTRRAYCEVCRVFINVDTGERIGHAK